MSNRVQSGSSLSSSPLVVLIGTGILGFGGLESLSCVGVLALLLVGGAGIVLVVTGSFVGVFASSTCLSVVVRDGVALAAVCVFACGGGFRGCAPVRGGVLILVPSVANRRLPGLSIQCPLICFLSSR